MKKKSQTWCRQSIIGMLLCGLGGASLMHASPQYPSVPNPEITQHKQDYPEVEPSGAKFYANVNNDDNAHAANPNMGNFYPNGNNGGNPYAANPNMGNFYANGNYGQNPYAGNFNGANFYANPYYVPGQYQPGTQGSFSWMPSWDNVARMGSEIASKWLPYLPKALAAVSNSSNLVSLKAFSMASKGMSALKLTTLARDEFIQSFNLIDLSTQEKPMQILEKSLTSFADIKGAGYGEIDFQLMNRIHIYDAGALFPRGWMQACCTNIKETIDRLAKILRRDVCCLLVKSGRGGRFQNFFPMACYVHYDPIKKRFLQKTANAGMMTDRSVRKSLGTWRIFDRLINGEVFFFVIDQDVGRARIVLPY